MERGRCSSDICRTTGLHHLQEPTTPAKHYVDRRRPAEPPRTESRLEGVQKTPETDLSGRSIPDRSRADEQRAGLGHCGDHPARSISVGRLGGVGSAGKAPPRGPRAVRVAVTAVSRTPEENRHSSANGRRCSEQKASAKNKAGPRIRGPAAVRRLLALARTPAICLSTCARGDVRGPS